MVPFGLGLHSLGGPSESEARLTLPHSRLHRFSEGSGIMKRLAVVLLFSLLTLLVAAPSALAAPPTHERVPVDDVVVDEESCGFPVEIHTTGFILAIEWVAEDGSLRRFEAYPSSRPPLRIWSPGRASGSISLGRPTLPRAGRELHPTRHG